ncbi:MAG: alpha-L-glutamate ligase, partial [Pseudomonadota bacterium]|nr:alpha-L-glutamate ligase [Pseudomonadota bacterium]
MPVDIFVIHENPEWLAPLAAALARRDARLVDWNMAERSVDLTQTPPVGVFFSRMSASSFSRGNDRVPELTSALFAWLERHGRRVVNGNPALRLELNKAAQYSALQAAGIPVPATHAALG